MWWLLIAGSVPFSVGEVGRFLAVDAHADLGLMVGGVESNRPVIRFPDHEGAHLTMAFPGRFQSVAHGWIAGGYLNGDAVLVRWRPAIPADRQAVELPCALYSGWGEEALGRAHVGGARCRFVAEVVTASPPMIGPFENRFDAVAIDSRGRYVAAGVAHGGRPTWWTDTFVCRLRFFSFCTAGETTSLVMRWKEFSPSGWDVMHLGRNTARWHIGPHDEANDVAVLPDDRLVVVGWASGDTYDDERTLVAVFDGPDIVKAEVSPLASKAGGTKEVLYGVAVHGDRIVTCGFSFDAGQKHIRALIKTYDFDLTPQWFALEQAKGLAGSRIEYFVKCVVDEEGNTYAVGYTDDDWAYGEAVDRALIAKYDATGERVAAWTSYQDGASVITPGKKEDAFDDVALFRDTVVAVGTTDGKTLIARFTRSLEPVSRSPSSSP